MLLPPYLSSRYRHLLSQEPESIVKASIKILLVCLIGFIGLFTCLVTLYLFQERNFLLIRACFCLLLFCTGLGLLLLKSPWTIAGHIFVGCLTFLVWSNTIFFSPSLSVIAVQYAIIVLASGYYILGIRWGLGYSLMCVLPIIAQMIVEHYLRIQLPIARYPINTGAYTMTICFNFLLLIFIHYSFFRALKKSKLKEANLRSDLQKALIAAQELGVAKTNFLTTMSHELRTPLNAVVGMTNILIMEDPRDGQAENLRVLKLSAENLMATVNDILDFNKINNETIILEKSTFELREVIEQVIASFKPQAEVKLLRLECQLAPKLADLFLIGDRMRLIQVLFQLVGNAIKFTDQGFVRLAVDLNRDDKDHVNVHFSVADSGIGIPQEVQANIFEPFTKSLSRTSRQFHGALGLTIAFQLVKLHGSELRFRSSEGHGTVFEFDLMYPVTTVKPATTPALAISAINGLRVLIVEDEKLNVLVLKKILSKWGISPDVAVDGQKGVDQVRANDYDVILMDINMPVMDGFEASRRIRELDAPGKASTPIIAITASVGAAIEQVKAYPYIDDCLLKPFDPEHLRERLMQIAGRNVLK